MNKEALRQFLVDSNKGGYAGGDRKTWIKDVDGSTTILFEKDSWKSHDNFFGGEPYGGRTVISYKDKPVWMMLYYGWVVKEVEADTVYNVLKNALMHKSKDYHFRGPRKYKEGGFLYTNSWRGEIEEFSGKEQICQNGKLVYRANYMGGLVDQRKGV